MSRVLVWTIAQNCIVVAWRLQSRGYKHLTVRNSHQESNSCSLDLNQATLVQLNDKMTVGQNIQWQQPIHSRGRGDDLSKPHSNMR